MFLRTWLHWCACRTLPACAFWCLHSPVVSSLQIRPFHLPSAGTHCSRQLQRGSGASVLDAVRAVLAQRTQKVCYGALDALPELMQQGECCSPVVGATRLVSMALAGAAPNPSCSLALKIYSPPMHPHIQFCRVPPSCQPACPRAPVCRHAAGRAAGGPSAGRGAAVAHRCRGGPRQARPEAPAELSRPGLQGQLLCSLEVCLTARRRGYSRNSPSRLAPWVRADQRSLLCRPIASNSAPHAVTAARRSCRHPCRRACPTCAAQA